MNLLNEARTARSYHRECLTTSNSLRDAYDRLRRESLWCDPKQYRGIVDRMSTTYNAYIAARNAAIEAEQDYNLAVTALLDNEE